MTRECLFSETYNVDNDFDQKFLCQVENILEINQSILSNVRGMPQCSSNLTDNTRNKEIRCSTKNYVQNIDDHYEKNLLFQAENLLQNNEGKVFLSHLITPYHTLSHLITP